MPTPAPVSIKSSIKLPFCERILGTFFFFWGLILILDPLVPEANRGLFYGQFESVMPTYMWGIVFAAVGLARYIAFKYRSKAWRRRLSALTFVLLSVVSSLAVYSGLWMATSPLAIFTAYVSFWCHRALIVDMEIGL